MLSMTMIVGRLAIVVPSLAIAGSMAEKKFVAYYPEKSFYTESAAFAILLICVIQIVSLLAYLPALCLGPILEHILMMRGVTF